VQLSLESMDVEMSKPRPSDTTAETAGCTCAYSEIPRVIECSSQGRLWRDWRADEGLIGSVGLRCFRSALPWVFFPRHCMLETHPTLASTLRPKHSAELWLFRGCTMALAELSWRHERHRVAAGAGQSSARVSAAIDCGWEMEAVMDWPGTSHVETRRVGREGTTAHLIGGFICKTPRLPEKRGCGKLALVVPARGRQR
jgi:hypothetical protein